MKSHKYYLMIVIAFIIVCYCAFAPEFITSDKIDDEDTQTMLTASTQTEISDSFIARDTSATSPPLQQILSPTPTPTQIPDPFKDFYGCEMQLKLISGPLEGQSTEFKILDKSYFEDKGDKFAVGKGTAVFYDKSPYLIVHSSYVNGNILRPMEAEFIRKYLEHWGNCGNESIQEQIDTLIGSEAEWSCDGESILKTKLHGIVRLSHQASDHLWLEPENIEKILNMREGETTEWIGRIDPIDDPSLYLGFCGWGPPSIEIGRYTYYRYLINFEVQDL